MDIKAVINSRHSVRNFLPHPIPHDILQEILEAGQNAPSAQNKQPWRYIVIQGKDKISQLVKHCGLIGLSNYFINTAPCVIIACANTQSNVRVNKQDYYLVDTAISFHQMILTAWSHGIGSCWMAAFSEKKLRDYLRIPPHWRIVAMSPFGYPAEKKSLYGKILSAYSQSSERLPLSKIIRFR